MSKAAKNPSCGELSPEMKEKLENGTIPERIEVGKSVYDNEETLPIFVPLEPGEKAGTTLPVLINDVRFNVQKGRSVMVPKTVHSVIMDSMNMTAEAEAEARLNADPSTSQI